jgi:hypothetical protein
MTVSNDPAPGGAPAGDPSEKPLSTADIEALVGKTVNAAVTSHLKRALGPAIAESIKSVPWKDVLVPVINELSESEPEPAPGGGNEPSRPDPKLTALEQKYADLERKYTEGERIRAEIEARSRDEKAMSSLRTALQPHVHPDFLDVVARDLFLGQKRVTFDESGRPLLTVKKAPYNGSPEEDVQLTLEDGAAHFAKTEGKRFAPPPAAPGNQSSRAPQGGLRSGTGRGADGMPVYDRPATTDAEKIQRAREQTAALAALHPHLARNNT